MLDRHLDRPHGSPILTAGRFLNDQPPSGLQLPPDSHGFVTAFPRRC
jgi:hypothetical protein